MKIFNFEGRRSGGQAAQAGLSLAHITETWLKKKPRKQNIRHFINIGTAYYSGCSFLAEYYNEQFRLEPSEFR